MSQFTENQRKIFLVAGIADLIIAIVVIGITIGRENSNFPIAVPVLLIVPGIILIILANKK